MAGVIVCQLMRSVLTRVEHAFKLNLINIGCFSSSSILIRDLWNNHLNIHICDG